VKTDAELLKLGRGEVHGVELQRLIVLQERTPEYRIEFHAMRERHEWLRRRARRGVR